MAFGQSTFADLGGAVSDIFAGFAAGDKAKGDLLEAQNYDLAAREADKEAFYTKESTAIQVMQSERQLYQSMSGTKADTAGAGFAASGSSLDILRSSAQQGALQQAVIQRQGLITEEGYEEQAQSYRNMEAAADMAASAEKKAGIGDFFSGGVKGAAAVATLFM
jgi:hypothetical protein